jgi:NAD(P)-dependent dehydrogenase (short-subunit alcohol dehydrogenase family)
MSATHLPDKVAIVTGGARGIGRAIAIRFAAEGARVVVNYVAHEEAAREVVATIEAAGGRAIAVAADVSQKADVDRLVAATIEQWGRVDVLVNNAGVHVAKGVLETSEDDWDRTMAVNLKGPYLCSKAVAPIMISQQGGKIINMSSNSGLYHPSAMRFTEYVVSKAGINGLTKAMALALGPYITVNAICPGWIRTEMLEEIDPAVHEAILAETALHRWGTPEEIAASAVFLASSEADFITGELLIVAGGRGMH